MQDLLDAIENDSLAQIKRLLKSGKLDLNSDVIIGQEYDLDEPDEVPLLFWSIKMGASVEVLELLIENGMNLNLITRDGLGAVDIAIKHKRFDILELCKDKGVDLTTTKRKSGLTPLMLAACFNDVELIKYLIKLGASTEHKDKHGMSALDYAKKMGQKKALEFLESDNEKD